jgi:hypothetical protein
MPNKSISRECCREAAKAVHAQMFAWDGFKHAPINECHKCDELAEIIAKHCHAEPKRGITFNEKGLEICREIVKKALEENPEATKAAFDALGFDYSDHCRAEPAKEQSK